MKYVQPYGISDPEAPYINGDPSIARMGSIPPAEAFEHPMRELVAVIDYSKLVPDSGDLEQVSKAVRSQRMNYCEDTGSVNTLSVAFDPPLTVYTIGLPIHVKVRNTNTGPSTIDAGAGRVPIRRPNGAEMAAGDLPGGGLAALCYDGTVFQMLNFGTAGGPVSPIIQQIPYCVDTSTTVNLVIANFSPAITALAAGLIIMVKIANTNNSFSNINVNGLGSKPIYAQGGSPNWPLLPGDIQANDTVVMIYDGTAFWIYPNTTITQSVWFYNIDTVTKFDQLFVALGRKRISTSGFVSIQLAPVTFGPAPGAFAYSILATYHADADRIAVVGTLKAGQSPPTTANFQRSGNSPAARANDAAANLGMLQRIYGTQIQLPGTPMVAVRHVGPGNITFTNILIVGPNIVAYGQAGFAVGASNCSLAYCCVWGSSDVGFECTAGGGSMTAINCHACACGSRGFAAAYGGAISVTGGGSYGNVASGLECAHGGAAVTGATDAGSPSGGQYGTLPYGFTASHNGSYGTVCDSGTLDAVRATIGSNAVVDMMSFNAGVGKQFLCSVGTMSPAAGTVGNLNAISVNYG